MAEQNQPIRVVAAKDGYQEDGLELALGYAKAIAERANAPDSNVILLTHTKTQLDYTSLSRMLGQGGAKALRNKKRIGLPWGGSLRHETLRTMPSFGQRAILIAYYGETKMLDAVDGIENLAGVVVVPDLEGSANSWIERWGPIIHGEDRPPKAQLIDDPIVEQALKTLTTMVNLSTGISHPRDKQQANEVIRILRAKGHHLDAEKVKSWAIRNGWTPKGAEDIAAIVNRVSALKSRPSLAKYHDPHGRYLRWKERA